METWKTCQRHSELAVADHKVRIAIGAAGLAPESQDRSSYPLISAHSRKINGQTPVHTVWEHSGSEDHWRLSAFDNLISKGCFICSIRAHLNTVVTSVPGMYVIVYMFKAAVFNFLRLEGFKSLFTWISLSFFKHLLSALRGLLGGFLQE